MKTENMSDTCEEYLGSREKPITVDENEDKSTTNAEVDNEGVEIITIEDEGEEPGEILCLDETEKKTGRPAKKEKNHRNTFSGFGSGFLNFLHRRGRGRGVPPMSRRRSRSRERNHENNFHTINLSTGGRGFQSNLSLNNSEVPKSSQQFQFLGRGKPPRENRYFRNPCSVSESELRSASSVESLNNFSDSGSAFSDYRREMDNFRPRNSAFENVYRDQSPENNFPPRFTSHEPSSNHFEGPPMTSNAENEYSGRDYIRRSLSPTTFSRNNRDSNFENRFTNNFSRSSDFEIPSHIFKVPYSVNSTPTWADTVVRDPRRFDYFEKSTPSAPAARNNTNSYGRDLIFENFTVNRNFSGSHFPPGVPIFNPPSPHHSAPTSSSCSSVGDAPSFRKIWKRSGSEATADSFETDALHQPTYLHNNISSDLQGRNPAPTFIPFRNVREETEDEEEGEEQAPAPVPIPPVKIHPPRVRGSVDVFATHRAFKRRVTQDDLELLNNYLGQCMFEEAEGTDFFMGFEYKKITGGQAQFNCSNKQMAEWTIKKIQNFQDLPMNVSLRNRRQKPNFFMWMSNLPHLGNKLPKMDDVLRGLVKCNPGFSSDFKISVVRLKVNHHKKFGKYFYHIIADEELQAFIKDKMEFNLRLCVLKYFNVKVFFKEIKRG